MRTRLGAAALVLIAGVATGLGNQAPTAQAETTAMAPVIYAHRGGAGIAPENTLGAFRNSHGALGPDGVWLEMDIQLTADDHAVVIHDDSLDRTTDCTGKVVHKSLAEVAACDASVVYPGWGQFEPVPAVVDVLAEGRDAGWRLMIELKDIPGEADFDAGGRATADALLAAIAATAFPTERLVVQSFWPPALDRIEERAPSIATALLTTSRLAPAPAGVGFWASENAVYATARGYEVTAPDYTSPDLSAATVDLIHATGRTVVPWTVDDPDDLAMVASWGVDGIITNRPDLAFAVFGSQP